MSDRSLILQALKARVSTILTANGFATDAGLAVFVGETPQLGKDDPDAAIAIVPLDATPEANRMESWPIELQALAKADLAAPYLSAFDILGDIVSAVELPDRTLGGLVKHIDVGPQRTLPREAGSTTVGIVQEYRISRVRVWGNP